MEEPPTSGCVFFSRHWALEDAPGSELFPGSALARAVLRLGEGPPLAARLRGTRRNGHRRVERASLLLREALRRERQGLGTHHDELWQLIHEEWTALGGSAPARDFLRDLAVSIGIPREEVDAEVDAVLGAIPNELLPGVHALIHSGLPAGSPARERLHFVEWRSAIRHNPQASPMLRSALVAHAVTSAREAVQEASYRSALVHFQAALELMPPSWPQTLLAHEACLAAEHWVGSLTSASRDSLEAVLATLARWSALLPHHFSLCRLRAALHRRLADGLLAKRHFSEAALHLLKARLLDPLGSSLAPSREDEASLVPESFLVFTRMPEGMALADESRTAALGETALRLGLLPSEPAVLSAVSALCLALGQEEGGGWNVLRRQLLQEHPVLAQVPCELLETLRGSGLSMRAEALAVHLPAPPPFSLDNSSAALLVAGWRRTCEQGIAAGSSSGRKGLDRWVFYPWLFSVREPLAKAAALVGVLLLAVGGTGLTQQAWEASRRDAAFQRFVAARQAEEPSRVSESARSFLRHDDRGRDPRFDQVVRGYEEAVLREAIDAARAGDTERAQRLSRESAALKARLERSGGAS
ncbi:hypothetical protein F0U60_33290 [Archangium minus]|uniref:Uncharacterized protein n=1 Tax=Archangium minus TaxID=83450 RepID=A0ABY9WZ88_9BACT|nr:hypothetical protein F0U60_33290 [Archangium minus]